MTVKGNLIASYDEDSVEPRSAADLREVLCVESDARSEDHIPQ
jgi:hypothetical protein